MRKLIIFLIVAVALSQIGLWLLKDPVGPASRKVLCNEGRAIILQRNNDGVREIWADTINDALKGLGYAHMEDRQVQMQFIRVVGQGRISELLANTPETVEFDKTFRKLRMYKDAVEALKTADKDVLEVLTAYTSGITDYEKEGHGRPLEFLLTGFKPDPWTMADTLVTVKLLSFASLAEIQGDMEKLLIANVKNDHAFKLFKKMFHPYLILSFFLRLFILLSFLGKALKNWDNRYSADAIGATLFEDFYKEIRDEIFIPIFGQGVWANFSKTGSHSVFYHYFDTAIFSEDKDYTSLLWIGRTREQTFERALNRTLSKYTNQTVPTWGQVRTGWMYNIFFNGQLPSVLGFDAPITVIGSRATVQQGQQFPGPGGRSIFFAPSWRMVTDVNKDLMETNLPGGPSGRRFSGLYYSGISDWFHYNYKNVELSPKPVIEPRSKDEL